MNVDKMIPVQFEQVATLDSRFTKVKIWLMHTGLNYNRSVFEKDVVEKAFPSLKNTPILAYIEESRSGEIDFAGHEMELVVKDGEVKVRYLGKAVGVIPDECNPRWEQKTGDNGQLLDYLVVDGIMWNKFDEAVDILQLHGEVSQSMELSDEYSGNWNNDGNFVFKDFSFYGACLLGQTVSPAMQKASVELFSTDRVYSVIQEKMNEYKALFSSSKEVEQEMTIEELLAKFSTTVEALAEKGVVVSDFSVEELEVKLEEVFTASQEAEGEEEEQPATQMQSEGEEGSDGEASQTFEQELNAGEDTGGEPTTFTLNFQLSHDDIRRKLYEGLDSHIANATGSNDSWNYIVSVYESYIVTESGDSNKFYMVDYSKDGENITLGAVKEVVPMFLTAEEKGALELMRSNFEKIETENADLKSFQTNVLKGQHLAEADQVFAKFSKLTEEEVSDIRENVHNFTLEEIESKCFERLGRKMANFSATSKPSTSYSLKIAINQDSDANRSGYDHILKKHGLS